jgi:eukaryotic-like serine/threonine-protein kinase
MAVNAQRVGEIVDQVRTIQEVSDRIAFLESACANDAELRREVEQALSVEEIDSVQGENQTRIEEPQLTDEFRAPLPFVEATGVIIAGKYKLLQQIGQGGMGSVWMADQTEPVKRRVAVKVIRADRSQSRMILARFEAERQAIALMDHPNIARLLDAGTIPDGSPYFIMQLIKGLPLSEYCDQHRLSIEDRLKLFMQICLAVQHAHQKGIIHRDLKPGNILVEEHDGKAVPRVIDFGLAKATSGMQLTDQTLFTGFGAFAGTPLYMAPEQASSNAVDIDTRADIYALGVILYELLTGSTPITRETIRKAALDEMLKLVREQEAPTPSSRLSSSDAKPSIAANRQMEPLKLGRFIKGELDWIVMKALAKERDRRYDSATNFAQDLERFLNQEPVQAGPPTMRYKLRKFVRRNRAQVIAASVLLLTLVGGVVGTTIGYLRAEKAREEEATQRQIADGKTTEALAAQAMAEKQKQRAISFRDRALDALRAMSDEDVEKLIGGKPELGPNEKSYLEGLVKRWQGFADLAGDDEETKAIRAEGTYRTGFLRSKLGQLVAAEQNYLKSLTLQQELLVQTTDSIYQPQIARTFHNYGMVLERLGKSEAAKSAYQQAINIRNDIAKHDPEKPELQVELANSRNNLATWFKAHRQYQEAREEHRHAIDIQSKLVKLHPDNLIYQRSLTVSQHNLAALLKDMNETREAEALYRDALKIRAMLVKQYPENIIYQVDLALTQNNLGGLLSKQNESKEGLDLFLQSLAIRQNVAKQFPSIPDYQENLASSYESLGMRMKLSGQMKEAKPNFRLAVDVRTKLVERNPDVPKYQSRLADSHNKFGDVLSEMDQHKESKDEYQGALDIYQKLTKKFPIDVEYQFGLGYTYCNIGNYYLSTQEPKTSIIWYRKAIDIQQQLFTQQPSNINNQEFLGNSLQNRAKALMELKQYRDAISDFDRIIAMGPSGVKTIAQYNRALCHFFLENIPQAMPDLEAVIKLDQWNGTEWFGLALMYSLASAKVPDKKQEYGDRTIEQLRKAIQKGYRDVQGFKTDPDLDPIRDRADFKQLLKELEALPKAKTNSKQGK